MNRKPYNLSSCALLWHLLTQQCKLVVCGHHGHHGHHGHEGSKAFGHPLNPAVRAPVAV